MLRRTHRSTPTHRDRDRETIDHRPADEIDPSTEPRRLDFLDFDRYQSKAVRRALGDPALGA